VKFKKRERTTRASADELMVATIIDVCDYTDSQKALEKVPFAEFKVKTFRIIEE
jgi:hypothetical protein